MIPTRTKYKLGNDMSIRSKETKKEKKLIGSDRKILLTNVKRDSVR